MERSIEDIIKDRYTVLRRQFHPGYTPNDAKTGGDWDDAASVARTIGADPVLFVDAQFHAKKGSGSNPFPWPKELHNRYAADNYAAFTAHFGSSVESRIEQQNTLLRAQIDGDLRMREIDIALSKAVLPFTSWFRVLMCSDQNLQKFKSVWGEYARKQVSTDRSLFDFLKAKYGNRANRLL